MGIENTNKIDIYIDDFLWIYETNTNQNWTFNYKKKELNYSKSTEIRDKVKGRSVYHFCFNIKGDYYAKFGNEEVLIKEHTLILKRNHTSKNRSNTLPYHEIAFDFTTSVPIDIGMDYNDFYLQIEVKEPDKIESIFTKIMSLSISKSPIAELEIKAQIYKLLSIFFGEYYNLKDEQNLPKIVSNAINYISNYLSKSLEPKEPLRVSDIAKKYHVTIDYFIRLFNQYVGQTPKQYINEVMLENAAALIEISDKSIKEIVDIMGFSSDIYFNKIFKRKYGTTPSKYRKTYNRFI